MAIPDVVALYQWLLSKPDMSFPMLNDGSFAPKVIDEASAQFTTNKDIFIKVARLKATKQKLTPEDLESAWFDNSGNYAGLIDFIRGSLQEGTEFPSTPIQHFARLGCSQ